ncbi:MAG TPA: alpha-L-fucosidase [Bryobacteraceae bacterium]|jgi:alpha-L-fucosidase|nr:alpha-L-fucosidase [Bryobacteraceae bacterium]
MVTRRTFLAAAAVRGLSAAARPLPSARQLRWHALETTAFLHFTVNTFTDKEWGYGDEDPNLFQPARFDADAIVSPLADAGMRGVILTAKHHDGFCLWPTATTDHSVRASGWRGGKGDVVRDIADAARRRGLLFGVYLSPWDRNNPRYGTPAYIEIYRRQLTELLTGYGDIFEVWHDGANGGDGYYGGAREKRTIDKRTYYDWPNTWALVRRLQPGAVIFSDVGPDVRWVGNERGIAGDPCWATYDPVGADGGPASPGDVREKESPTGHRNGSHWLPAECDVSIRPGWFWHERENARVKTPQQLIDLYYRSVGRGANLLLNVPPNRDGLLGAEDIASLRAFGEYRRRVFAKPVAPGAEFNVIRVREDIRYGQRIDEAVVEGSNGRAWEELARVTSIGPRRIVRLGRTARAQKLRVRALKSSAPPKIAEVAAFLE